MRIKCPECESVLSLGQPKPGSYKPKCKHCGKLFRLKVTDDDPPKVGIGRMRTDSQGGPSSSPPKPGKPKTGKPASQPKPASSKAPPTVAATMDSGAGTEATMDSAAGTEATMDEATSDSGPGTEATMDSAAGMEATMDSASGMEATMDSAAGSPSAGGMEATMDSAHSEATQAAGVEATMDTSASEKTQSNVDATVDGTVQGSQSSAASSKSVSVSHGGKKAGKTVVSAGGSAAKSRGKKKVAKRPSADAAEIPERLGGYRILRLLGRGAMGAVYEAKQVSLDRLVALKTIRGRLANNPASLARFTREAYAAAQLTHHNVVQIYDFGEDDGKHFFSMEWVRGGPLDDLIRDKGALDPRLAAGYTLQAARGLQFAHRNGMVHRDIKPANLLLSDEGVVKVADLGLVKVPDQPDPESDVGAMSGMESGTQVTMQGTAVGTPAYMAPEQGVDAAAVDHRADIYSLGCTLFYLLSGRPPFEGSVVSEVLEQHAKQPLPSLVKINPRVPEELANVVEQSMAKRPEDRYASISEMIVDLEVFLGVSPEGEFSPTSDQADKWERIAFHFAASAKQLRLARTMLTGLICVSAFLTLVMPLVAGLGWLLLGPALFAAAITAALALGARGGQSPVVTKFRGWVSSLSWFDYGVGAIGAIVFLMVAIIAGMAPGMIVGGVLGVIAGAAYHFLLIVPSRRRRQPVIDDAERFIRDLRIDGADEEGVRSFAARYGGEHWQGLFEGLFGYDSLCEMRDHLHGDPSFSGSTASNSLRDKVCARFAAKSKANREARDHQRLAKLEERGLQSEGVSAVDARDRAWQMAAAVMDNAKAVAPAPSTPQDPQEAAEEKRQKMKAMLAEARSGKYKKQRDKGAPLRFVFGGHTRLLAGCILLVIFAIWGKNNGLFDVESFDQLLEKVKELMASGATLGGANSLSVGIAGLLLAMSSFVSGWRMTPFAVVATIVILFGPSFGIPAVAILDAWMVAALAGVAVYLPGIIFGESKDDAQW